MHSSSAQPAMHALRNQIRAEIATIDPLDALEHEHQAYALSWIDSGVELCRLQKPATPPIHLVSYFAVVDGSHLLLVDHKNARLWLPSGGHVAPGEHPRETVRREVAEELGIHLDGLVNAPVMVTCATTVGLTAGHTDVSLWYVLPGDRTRSVSFDTNEFHGVRWFGFAEAPLERSDPHLGRFLRKLARDDIA